MCREIISAHFTKNTECINPPREQTLGRVRTGKVIAVYLFTIVFKGQLPVIVILRYFYNSFGRSDNKVSERDDC